MKKTADTSHKAHLSCGRRHAARSAHEVREWLAASPGRGAERRRAEVGDDSGSDAAGRPGGRRPLAQLTGGAEIRGSAETTWDAPATTPAKTAAGPMAADGAAPDRPSAVSAPGVRECADTPACQGCAPACMVDPSAQRETGAWRPGCRTRLTRGSGARLPVRGTRLDGWRGARAAHSHGPRNRQGAYCAADGTAIQRAPRISRLSLCETLSNVQDLLTATLSNHPTVYSNIFRFVMT